MRYRGASDHVDLICSLCKFRSRVVSMHWAEKKAANFWGNQYFITTGGSGPPRTPWPMAIQTQEQ